MKNEISDKIFSYDIFKNINKKALIQKFCTIDDPLDMTKKSTCKNKPRTHNEKMISHIPAKGIIIKRKGKYRFSNDIIWKPKHDGCVAITIAADGVELDLNGHILKIETKKKLKNTVIKVKNHNSISILNGKLFNMNYRAMDIQGVENLNIKNINIDTLNYKDKSLSSNGIYIQGAKNVNIVNCKVKNFNVKAPSCIGIQLIEAKNFIISNCKVSNLTNKDGSVQGFSFLLCENAYIDKCSSSKFQSHYIGKTNTKGHTVLGFFPLISVNLIFKDCSAQNIIGCCDDCHGMGLFFVLGVDVINFYANNISDAVKYKKGAKSTGIEVYGVGVNIINSLAKNIKAKNAEDKQCSGFSVAGIDINFISCISDSINDNTKTKSIESGFGTGFGWAPDPRLIIPALNVKYIDCVSNKCQVGFDTWNHIDSSWFNITTSKCDIPYLIQKNTQRIFTANKCSEGKPGDPKILSNMAKNNICIDSDFSI